jgi:hypothetical protein
MLYQTSVRLTRISSPVMRPGASPGTLRRRFASTPLGPKPPPPIPDAQSSEADMKTSSTSFELLYSGHRPCRLDRSPPIIGDCDQRAIFRIHLVGLRQSLVRSSEANLILRRLLDELRPLTVGLPSVLGAITKTQITAARVVTDEVHAALRIRDLI